MNKATLASWVCGPATTHSTKMLSQSLLRATANRACNRTHSVFRLPPALAVSECSFNLATSTSNASLRCRCRAPATFLSNGQSRTFAAQTATERKSNAAAAAPLPLQFRSKSSASNAASSQAEPEPITYQRKPLYSNKSSAPSTSSEEPKTVQGKFTTITEQPRSKEIMRIQEKLLSIHTVRAFLHQGGDLFQWIQLAAGGMNASATGGGSASLLSRADSLFMMR